MLCSVATWCVIIMIFVKSFGIFRYCNPQRPLDGVNTLLASLEKYCKPVKTVVNWCITQQTEQERHLAPISLRPLLLSLAKPSPVCALVPATHEAKDLLENMKTTDVKQDPVLLQLLQNICPVLFELVKNLNVRDRSLPGVFDSLLDELWSKSIAPFEGLQPTNDQLTADDSDSFEESISFWPHMPVVRDRGR